MASRERTSGGVAGVLLAAGAGRRLGRPKAGLLLEGERLVDRGVATMAEGGCAPVHVVTGAARVTVAGATSVANPDWERGMGTSLRRGLESLPATAPAAVIALVDQPLITAEAVARLRDAWSRGAAVAVATYAGAPRNPVLLDRRYWPMACAAAEGDVGARPFLRTHPRLVTRVPCEDVASPDDVDTPEELDRIRRAPAAAARHERPRRAAARHGSQADGSTRRMP